MNHRAVAAPVLALMLAAILVAAAGPATMAGVLAQTRWSLIGLAALVAIAFQLARGLRWSLLLRAPRDPAGNAPAEAGPQGAASGDGPGLAAKLSAVGWMVSSFVPLKAGDAVRTAWMARRTGRPLVAVAGSVAVERTFDILGIALASSLGLALLASLGIAGPPWLSSALTVAWLLPLAALAVLAALAFALPRRTSRGGLVGALAAGLATLPALGRQPHRLAAVAALTVVVAVAQAAVYALLALAVIPGLNVAAAAGAAPLFALAFALPLTPANLGTYEAGFAAAFGLAGAPVHLLLPAALAAHGVALALAATLGSASLALLLRQPRARAAPRMRPAPQRHDEEATA